MKLDTMLLLKPLFFAASAAALVIIPELSEADEDIFRALPIDEPIDETAAGIPLAPSINVPCRQCHGSDTHLQLNFSLEAEKRLMVNGFELYPGIFHPSGGLSATVVDGDGEPKEELLGYALGVRSLGVDKYQQFEAINVGLRVIKVGDRYVDGIRPIEVKLIKAPGGELLITSVELLKGDKGDKGSSDERCTSMLCRFEKLFGDTWKGLKGDYKGCGGMRAHGSAKGDRVHPHGKSWHKNGDHRKGGHHRHNGKNHKEGRHRSWGKIIQTVISYVVLPILVGAITGVSLAIITLFLSGLVVRFVRFLRGGRCQDSLGCLHKAADVEAVAYEAEKSGLIADQELPPQYEEEDPRN